MKIRRVKNSENYQHLLNAILERGPRRGHGLVTLERADPEAIRRGSRSILSLDQVVETVTGQLDSLGDRLDPATVIGHKVKTIAEQIHERNETVSDTTHTNTSTSN